MRTKVESAPKASRRARRKTKPPKRKRTLIAQDGILTIAVAVLLTFSASARGINLLMALGAFFVGFLAIDFFWGRSVLKGLRATRRLPDSVYAGEPFYVEIELDASDRSSSAWSIVVEDCWERESAEYDFPSEAKEKAAIEAVDSSGGKKRRRKSARAAAKAARLSDAALGEGVETLKPVVYFPSIRKREKIKEFYIGVFTRRGIRRLKSLTLSTRFPCGFFRSSERFDAPDETIVFPRIGRLTGAWANFAEGNVSQESNASSNATSRIPDETIAIRDWRQGDSKRTIAWRASAKRGKLQARDFTKRRTRAVVLILDLYQSASSSKEEELKKRLIQEKAISFAQTLLRRYSESGDSQLYFGLNADVPILNSEKKRVASDDSSQTAIADWDLLHGGGSIRSASARLALALAPRTDRLRETFETAKSFNLKNARVFVVTVEPTKPERLGDARLDDALFIDASDPSFDSYFEWGTESVEGVAN